MSEQSLPEKALARAVMCLLDYGQGIVVSVDNEMMIVYKKMDGTLFMNDAALVNKNIKEHWHGNIITVESKTPTIH